MGSSLVTAFSKSLPTCSFGLGAGRRPCHPRAGWCMGCNPCLRTTFSLTCVLSQPPLSDPVTGPKRHCCRSGRRIAQTADCSERVHSLDRTSRPGDILFMADVQSAACILTFPAITLPARCVRRLGQEALTSSVQVALSQIDLCQSQVRFRSSARLVAHGRQDLPRLTHVSSRGEELREQFLSGDRVGSFPDVFTDGLYCPDF